MILDPTHYQKAYILLQELSKVVAKLAEEGKGGGWGGGIRWWWGLGWGYSATVEGLGGVSWRVAVRNIRRDALKAYEKLEKEKKLSEDNVKDLSADLQVLSGLKVL
ncbi:Ribosome-recycling factor chloroplastic [Bienertia sinuspersici]